MEELTAIKTAEGREFKPWVDADKLQQIVSDPSSVTALASEIAETKHKLAAKINELGGDVHPTDSYDTLIAAISSLTGVSQISSAGMVVNHGQVPFLQWALDLSARTSQQQSNFSDIDNDTITDITASGGFRDSMLRSISLSSVTSISGGNIWQNSLMLTSISLPRLVTISGSSVWQNCGSLVSISLPNLTSISGASTFHGCNLLKDINLPNLATISSETVFAACNSIVSISLPSLTSVSGGSVNKGIFFNCVNLEIFTAPNLTVISSQAMFQSNSKLKSITLGKLTTLNTNFNNTVLDYLENFTVGEGTDINLALQNWRANMVDVTLLNENLYNNLLTKLYDHSQDGVTRTLRIGWLAKVTAENIAYANAKGWTLTT